MRFLSALASNFARFQGENMKYIIAIIFALLFAALLVAFTDREYCASFPNDKHCGVNK
jgi:hypothetical protein